MKAIDQDRWARAYLSELDRAAEETGDRKLDTVFFGGGTPSLMEPHLVDQIMDRIRRNWSLANNFEATMEANPSSVEADRFTSYCAAGVDRVSLGVQALNDIDLRKLGRLHSAEEARRAVGIAQGTFDRVSFDLIYARQDQSLEDWRDELQAALAIGTDHLSLYQLTIEQGTAFGDRFNAGKLRGLPVDDLAADMFELTQEMTTSAGLPAYEVSNHARPGQESRHNLIYWRGGDYVGIGPGAHGRLTIDGTRFATDTPLGPSVWLKSVEEAQTGEGSRTELSQEEQDTEYVMMGLRCDDGIDLARLSRDAHSNLYNKINVLEEHRLVQRRGDRLIVPPTQRIVLNAILSELLT